MVAVRVGGWSIWGNRAGGFALGHAVTQTKLRTKNQNGRRAPLEQRDVITAKRNQREKPKVKDMTVSHHSRGEVTITMGLRRPSLRHQRFTGRAITDVCSSSQTSGSQSLATRRSL